MSRLQVPDHDDKVSQGALSDAYDKTAEAWKERFGVPYSVCGCLPPIKALELSGNSGSSFSIFSKKGKAKAAAEKPFENSRPDLTLPSNESAEQTHPSDHNAVAILNPAEPNMAQVQVRRRELAKRAKELSKSVEKGKANQWGEVMHRRMVDHTPSFLCPVQYGESGDSDEIIGPRPPAKEIALLFQVAESKAALALENAAKGTA
ncbi:hypothetical protein FRC05_001286 [Tulasnella sp. 425]|nr:hypothetical protein FRC05_001286 [Tulasnella sp. 425]